MNEKVKKDLQEVLNNLNKMQDIFSHINTNKIGLSADILSVKSAVSAIEDAGVNIYLSLLRKENPNNIELSIQKRSDVVSILKENKLSDRIIYDDKNGTMSFNLNYDEATKIRSTILRRCNLEKGDLKVNYLINNNEILNKIEIKKVNGTASEFQKYILEVEKSYLLDRGYKKTNSENKDLTILDCLDTSALFIETIEELKKILNKQNMSVLVKLEQGKKSIENAMSGLHNSLIKLNNEKNISLEVENRIDISREIEKHSHVIYIDSINELPKNKDDKSIFVIKKDDSIEILMDREQAVRMRSHLQNNCSLSNNEIKSFYLFENEDSMYKIKLKTDIKSGAEFEKNILTVQKMVIESYGDIVSGKLDKLDINLTEIPKEIIQNKNERKKGIKMV